MIFSAIHIALAVHSHSFKRSMLWVGGSTHLWFLPFILEHWARDAVPVIVAAAAP